MNITLIGMPGSGKTHIGQILAKELGYGFFDADAAIENEYGLPLPEILAKIGKNQFLKKEGMVVISYISGKDRLVISPGGSIVYRKKAMECLNKISTIIYLKTALPVIENRIGNAPRGIVDADKKTIAEIYTQRLPLYDKWANIIVDGGHDAGIIAQNILNCLDLARK
jgi:shikimate kinase